jgi:hypothetical protein
MTFAGRTTWESLLYETNHPIQKTLTVEAENKEWEAKYGKEGQRIIRETVDANIPHYEHLKQFCIKV